MSRQTILAALAVMLVISCMAPTELPMKEVAVDAVSLDGEVQHSTDGSDTPAILASQSPMFYSIDEDSAKHAFYVLTLAASPTTDSGGQTWRVFRPDLVLRTARGRYTDTSGRSREITSRGVNPENRFGAWDVSLEDTDDSRVAWSIDCDADFAEFRYWPPATDIEVTISYWLHWLKRDEGNGVYFPKGSSGNGKFYVTCPLDVPDEQAPAMSVTTTSYSKNGRQGEGLGGRHEVVVSLDPSTDSRGTAWELDYSVGPADYSYCCTGDPPNMWVMGTEGGEQRIGGALNGTGQTVVNVTTGTTADGDALIDARCHTKDLSPKPSRGNTVSVTIPLTINGASAEGNTETVMPTGGTEENGKTMLLVTVPCHRKANDGS